MHRTALHQEERVAAPGFLFQHQHRYVARGAGTARAPVLSTRFGVRRRDPQPERGVRRKRQRDARQLRRARLHEQRPLRRRLRLMRPRCVRRQRLPATGASGLTDNVCVVCRREALHAAQPRCVPRFNAAKDMQAESVRTADTRLVALCPQMCLPRRRRAPARAPSRTCWA